MAGYLVPGSGSPKNLVRRENLLGKSGRDKTVPSQRDHAEDTRGFRVGEGVKQRQQVTFFQEYAAIE